MQPRQLRVTDILQYAVEAHPTREIVSRDPEGETWRGNYAALGKRAQQAASALAALGVRAGDRVATLAWNTYRHFDLFYAVPAMGAVLATVNPRLFEAQCAWVLNHTGARVLLFDRSLADLVDRMASQLTQIQQFVVLGSGRDKRPGPTGALSYDELLAEQEGGFEWPERDENEGAVLCYTSGTTGDPKGVLYSHRSIVLHGLVNSHPDALGIGAYDVVMPCSSLYHATAWGLPYMAPMHGAKLVLPGERLDATNIAALIREEGVTFTCGVPTIWTTYLNYLEQTGAGVAKLARVLVGGACMPQWMGARFAQYGVQTVQGWGMTETSPVGVAGTRTPQVDVMFGSDDTDYIRSRQGRLLFGVQLRIVDDDDKVLPFDGVAAGHIQVRGPYVIQRYFNSDSSAANPQGWFDTGDIGTVDPQGYLRLTDRAKDLIKSGGEWISSIDIENRVSSYPGVRLAAVIGIPHPKWDERPLLIVDAQSPVPTAAQLIDHLRPHLARWWLPDDVVFAPIPLTATGKIDKRTLRTTYRDRFAGPKCPPASAPT